MADNCWVLVHTDSGTEVDNGDHVPHFDTENKAKEISAEWEGTAVRQREQSCLIVGCDCGCCPEVFDESGEGYTVHFDNAADAAMVTEAEWTRHADGSYRCIACSPGGDCDCREGVLAAAEQGDEVSAP